MSFMNPATDQIGRKSDPAGYGGDRERLGQIQGTIGDDLGVDELWEACGGLSLLSFVCISYILASVRWPKLFLSVNE